MTTARFRNPLTSFGIALCLSMTTLAQEPSPNIDTLSPEEILQRAFDRERAMGNVRGALGYSETMIIPSRQDMVTRYRMDFLYRLDDAFLLTGFNVGFAMAMSSFGEDIDEAKLYYTVWDGTKLVLYMPETKTLYKYSDRTMSFPNWDMCSEAMYTIEDAYPQIWPMHYWLSDVEEAGLDNRGLRIASREANLVKVTGTHTFGSPFSVTVDLAKGYLPIRLDVYNDWGFFSEFKRFDVDFADFRQTSNGTWYAGSMDVSQLGVGVLFVGAQYQLDEFDDHVTLTNEDLDVQFLDAKDVEDYSRFFTWLSYHKIGLFFFFEWDDPDTWAWEAESISDHVGAAIVSFYYAFPDFHGLQAILALMTLAATFAAYRFRHRIPLLRRVGADKSRRDSQSISGGQ